MLVYDGTGRHAATSCALQLARQGSTVRIATPDDALAVEMSYIDRSSLRKRLAELGVHASVEIRLEKVERRGNGLQAVFRHELTGAESIIEASQVVIENGTLPATETFDALRALSSNDGVTEVGFMLGREEAAPPAPGRFLLHRIGDAVASRDVYSAIHEAFRLCSKL